jgi:hypothetical protein
MKSFQSGDRVFQAQYGAGDIRAVDERYTIIEFDDGAVRKFVTRLLQARPSTEPRPVKPPPPARPRPRKRQTTVSGPDDIARIT